MKKTKIIATLGPSSASPKIIEQMMLAGMNVARLNFSHGDYKNHEALIKIIRKVSVKLNQPIAIIQDLHGPKVRVGNLQKPIDVKVGDKVTIGEDFNMDYDVSPWVKPNQRLLIEDGLIELNILKVGKPTTKGGVGKIYLQAMTAGKIQAHKGINLPRTKLRFSNLTDKDLEDLKFGLKHNVDYVALSFVRSKKDIVTLKKYIKRFNPKGFFEPKIIAKIETLEGVQKFDEILSATDAVMVARGDMGVELPESEVPVYQKTFIQKCLKASKPVIVATQMLDSMIRNPRPTRAEVSDVANAVLDQTDCVMLSGETAFGKYPLKAVSEMAKIIETIEQSTLPENKKATHLHVSSRSEAIADAVFEILRHVHLTAVVGATDSGFTARQIARIRPASRIIMFTPKVKTYQQMSLVWGVESFMMSKVKTYEDLIDQMHRLIQKYKLIKKGSQFILATGEPIGQRENLNLVEIKTV
jgi:pyruvate kinase